MKPFFSGLVIAVFNNALARPESVRTVDKENIEINTFCRWRITDARKFYEAVRTERRGQNVLDGAVDSAVKNVISSHQLMEVLRNTKRQLKYSAQELEDAERAKNVQVEIGREAIVADILSRVRANAQDDYGIRVESLGIKQINYVRAVIPKIFDRMRSERTRIANRYESEGRERQERILGELARDMEKIESEAYKKATTIRGQADAEAIKIYAEAYGKDAEFFSFQRTLETYKSKNSVRGQKTIRRRCSRPPPIYNEPNRRNPKL